MSIRNAVEALVLLVLVVNLALTYGVMRKIRYGNFQGQGTSLLLPPPVSPAPGWVVRPGLDRVPWSSDLATALTGESIVILSVPGCPGCETVKRELDFRGEESRPVWVLVEPAFANSEALDYLKTWPESVHRVVAPDQFELMNSFGNPTGYPVVMALRDGVVTSSGYRLRELTDGRAARA